MSKRAKLIRTIAGLTVRGLLLLLLMTYLLPGPIEALVADYDGDIREPLSQRAIGHYDFMKNHFEAPFEGYGATEVFIQQYNGASRLICISRVQEQRIAERLRALLYGAPYGTARSRPRV